MAEEVQKVRLFVAVFPDEAVVHKLQAAVGDVRKKLGPKAIRWTLPEQMHVTMAFIGSVERTRVAEFEAALESVARKAVGCTLETAGVGCFPNNRRPRVVWAGLSGELTPLLELQKNLEKALQGLGYIPEEREFHPHLTLGRVNLPNPRDIQVLGEFLESLKTGEFGRWQVDRIDLMQSVLSPKGSKYTVLKSCALSCKEKS